MLGEYVGCVFYRIMSFFVLVFWFLGLNFCFKRKCGFFGFLEWIIKVRGW